MTTPEENAAADRDEMAESHRRIVGERRAAYTAADVAEARLGKANATTAELRAELAVAKKELSTVSLAANRLNGALNEARATVDDLRHDQSTQETLKDAMRATIAEQAAHIERLVELVEHSDACANNMIVTRVLGCACDRDARLARAREG